MPHVFVSYVRENAEIVERLCSELRSHGVDIWLDRDQLTPGGRWGEAIREAIRSGGFFLACFSQEYNERSRTYMNEELTLAIDELRKRPTNQSWCIPLLLNACEVPDRSIGAGETLRSLQWVALYDDWDQGIERILSVVRAGQDSVTEEPIPRRRALIDLWSNPYDDLLSIIHPGHAAELVMSLANQKGWKFISSKDRHGDILGELLTRHGRYVLRYTDTEGGLSSEALEICDSRGRPPGPAARGSDYQQVYEAISREVAGALNEMDEQ